MTRKQFIWSEIVRKHEIFVAEVAFDHARRQPFHSSSCRLLRVAAIECCDDEAQFLGQHRTRSEQTITLNPVLDETHYSGPRASPAMGPRTGRTQTHLDRPGDISTAAELTSRNRTGFHSRGRRQGYLIQAVPVLEQYLRGNSRRML